MRHGIKLRPDRPIQCYAEKRDHFRTAATDLAIQHFPAFDVFGMTQVIDSRTRPGDQIRDAQVPDGQPYVIFVR